MDFEKLLKLLSSTKPDQRMAGIRMLQEDLSKKKPDLTPEIIKILDHIACSDENLLVMSEAQRLLDNDEYLAIYHRLNITLPLSLSHGSDNWPQEITAIEQPIWEKFVTVIGVLGSLAGTLLIILGIYYSIDQMPFYEWGVFGYILVGLPVQSIGSLLFILGYWFFIRKRSEKKQHALGIVFTVFGLLVTSSYIIGNIALKEIDVSLFDIPILGLTLITPLIGIFFLFIGFWDIIRKKKQYGN